MRDGRLLRALLRVLPFDFRSDYGGEIEQTFRDQRRDAAGPLQRARVWSSHVAALFAIGPREHLAQLRQDMATALRGMRRNPGYAAAAMLVLALGTGVNTAVFDVVHAVLLRPLPYREPARLVSVANRWDGLARAELSVPEYLDYMEQSRTLEIAAMVPSAVAIAGGAGEPESVPATWATPNIFTVLGRQPALGRGFTRQEGEREGSVAIISDALWRSRFGSDPAVIGRSVDVDGAATPIVGVLPADLILPTDLQAGAAAALVLPTGFNAAAPRDRRGGHFLTGVGRLRDDATRASASAEMDAIVSGLIRRYPEEHDQGNFGVVLEPLRDVLLGDSRPILWVLGCSVALVLLLACANVASLMIARGEARRRELSIRVALGASRFRISRQLVTEAFVLCVGATGLGCLLASWARPLIVSMGAATLPRLDADPGLAPPVLGFAAALAVVTTFLFGAMPALQLSSLKPIEALKEGTRGASRARARRALVVCQVSLAVVLLVGAGLLFKSFVRVVRAPGGFDASHVLTARMSLPETRYQGLTEVNGFYARLLERTRALPGVERAGASTGLPLAVASGDWSFEIEGRPRVDGREPGRADWYVITPGYLEALRIPVTAGRGPAESDTWEAPRTIFLNESAARTLFPGQDPIGTRVRLTSTTGAEQPWRTIAGIIADVRQHGLDQNPRPEMFIPYGQFLHFLAGVQARSMTLVVRTSGRPDAMMSSVRAAVQGIDPLIPLADARAMDGVLSASMADRRLHVTLVGTFALLAVVLATIGIYGVVAQDTLQRTREIGIHMALGASSRSVVSMVVGRGLRPVAAGGAVGLGLSLLLADSVSRLLFEVDPRDAAVFASVAALLVIVGAVASYLPARRAARVDPVLALRAE